MEHSNLINVKEIQITDKFWFYYQKLLREVILPYQWEALNDRIEGAEPSYCIHNLKVAAGEIEGEYKGPVYQDHGIIVWLEAVGGSLAHHPDPELEAMADEAIELLGRVQRENGYLNSYFIVKDPGAYWTNLMEGHELFCAGHMIEAAIMYWQATGKDRFLNIVRKYVDYIDSVFGPEEGKCKGYPGHQEIELALMKLYRATNEERYLKLACYFVDQRGTEPNYFLQESERLKGKRIWGGSRMLIPSHYQAHKPVRKQRKAIGHAVRAVYLYTAMADIAAETGDKELADACYALFDNITNKQMYITGGVGATHLGEAFTFDYDLPNDTVYQETCASIGLALFASRMMMLDHNARYADIIEQALYNSMLSGISRDGRSFFYVNPMEIWTKEYDRNPDREHIKTVRQPWYRTACCPPNIARTIASVGQYVYSTDKDGIYVNLYVGSTYYYTKDDQKIKVTMTEDYLDKGTAYIRFEMESSARFTLALRKPGWCGSMHVRVNGEHAEDIYEEGGYFYLNRSWNPQDQVDIDMELAVRVMCANPAVRANAGKIALMRGPLVYCLEEMDNGANLNAITIPRDQSFETAGHDGLPEGVPAICGEAFRLNDECWDDQTLYSQLSERAEQDRKIRFCAVPYFMWGNREKGEMQVWMRGK